MAEWIIGLVSTVLGTGLEAKQILQYRCRRNMCKRRINPSHEQKWGALPRDFGGGYLLRLVENIFELHKLSPEPARREWFPTCRQASCSCLAWGTGGFGRGGSKCGVNILRSEGSDCERWTPLGSSRLRSSILAKLLRVFVQRRSAARLLCAVRVPSWTVPKP